MRAPEPRSNAVIPVPHCPNVTVPRVDYRLFKVGGAHTPSYPNSVAITQHGRTCGGKRRLLPRLAFNAFHRQHHS